MRFLKSAAAALAALCIASPVLAWEPAIRYIDIDALLRKDGSMDLTEHWDCTPASGTEWYLVRGNLADATISNLRVSDENGQFENAGDWNVDASMDWKTGRCGLNRIDDGYEICWGVGSYGPHKYTVSYTVGRAVKAMDDYDMLHWQFVSPGLSSSVDSVKLTIRAEDVALDTTVARVWGFGWKDGSTAFEDGTVIARSGRFDRDCSMIILLRLDKGLLSPVSVVEGTFEEHSEEAFKGSAFEDEDDDDNGLWMFLAFAAIAFIFMFIAIRQSVKKITDRKKRIYGTAKIPGKPEWCRSIPFSGNIGEAWFAWAWRKGAYDGESSIIAAIMLRYIQHGNIVGMASRLGRPQYQLNPKASKDWMADYEKTFFDLAAKAAGDDGILQEKEFRRWSAVNKKALADWMEKVMEEVAEQFSKDSLTAIPGGKYTCESLDLNPEGQRKALETLGFCQYLKDYTIINERSAGEVALWQDYLTMAAVFGIAAQVAKEFKNICPDWKITAPGADGTATVYDATMMYDVCRMGNAMNHYTMASITATSLAGTSAARGLGGGVSFGGGGGFSGGGFGGGSR